MNNSSHMTDQKEVQNEIYAMVLLSVVPLIVIANGMVIEVIRRKGNSRKTNDLFILNLAVSDLLYGLSILSDISYLYLSRSPPTTAYCKILSPFQTVIYFVSILTLVSMAIERHYVILNTFNIGIRKRWLRVWLFVIWFLSNVFVIPYFIVIWATKGSCGESWPSHTHRQVYTAVLFILQFPLPLLIIIVCYVKIGIFLARYRLPGEACHTTSQPDLKEVKARKTSIRFTKIVAAIIVLFVLMNLPQQLAWMILDFGSSGNKKLALFLMNIALFSTAVHSFTNAIVYGILLKQFRKEFTGILCNLCICCRFQRRPSGLACSKAG